MQPVNAVLHETVLGKAAKLSARGRCGTRAARHGQQNGKSPESRADSSDDLLPVRVIL